MLLEGIFAAVPTPFYSDERIYFRKIEANMARYSRSLLSGMVVLGSTGEVGIDHDYNSLRQDLWLATDQAYKEAATQMSLKQAFLRSLTKPPEIDDFSQERATVKIEPRELPDWTSRKWEEEARAASAALKSFPQLYGTRVNYYFVYTTYYLMNSEGTELRTSKKLAALVRREVEGRMQASRDLVRLRQRHRRDPDRRRRLSAAALSPSGRGAGSARPAGSRP